MARRPPGSVDQGAMGGVNATVCNSITYVNIRIAFSSEYFRSCNYHNLFIYLYIEDQLPVINPFSIIKSLDRFLLAQCVELLACSLAKISQCFARATERKKNRFKNGTNLGALG